MEELYPKALLVFWMAQRQPKSTGSQQNLSSNNQAQEQQHSQQQSNPTSSIEILASAEGKGSSQNQKMATSRLPLFELTNNKQLQKQQKFSVGTNVTQSGWRSLEGQTAALACQNSGKKVAFFKFRISGIKVAKKVA
jgi:hypothetical protein